MIVIRPEILLYDNTLSLCMDLYTSSHNPHL